MEDQRLPRSPHFVASTISLGTLSMVSVALGFVGTVIMTRYFSTELFGTYTLALVAVSLIGQISTFGLEMGISRFISASRDDSAKEALLSTAVIIRIGAMLLACLLAWFGRPYLMQLLGGSISPDIFIYIPLLFVLESSRSFLRAILQGCLLFTRIGISDVITSGLNFILLVAVIFTVKSDQIAWLILIRVFATLLSCIYAYISIPIRKRLTFQAAAFKELLKFGFPLQINDVLHFVSTRVDTLVVAALLGPADVAFYEIARKIPDNLRTLYEPFRAVYYPFLTKRYALEDPKQASKLLHDSMRFVAFLLILGTAISLLFAKEIITLLFSDKYLASSPVFIILMVNLSIALVCNVMGTTLVAVGDSNKPLIINTFNALVSLLGSIFLIPPFRIIGAAVANTIGTTLAYPLNIYFLRKKIDLMDTTYLKPFALFGGWSLLVFIIKPELFLIKILFLIIFIAASFFLRIITRAELVLLLAGSGALNWKPLQRFGTWVTKQ